jgi:hypothetical protein
LATVNNHTEVWVGDTGGTCFPQVGTPAKPPSTCGKGQVWVLNTDASIKTLPGGAPNPIVVGLGTGATSSRADEFCYDPKDNLVMIASPAEQPFPFVTFISTTTYKVVKRLVFDGMPGNGPKATNGLEQCGWSAATGLFYQNVPEINGAGDDTSPGAIAVIDPKKMVVDKLFHIPLQDCAGPQGMAIGPGDQILEGCNAAGPNGRRNTVIVSQKNGAILSVLADAGGADEVWFNPGDGHYIIPSCNTACRTPPTPFALTGPEVLQLVDSVNLFTDQTVFVASQNSDTTITTGNPRTIHSVAGDPANKQIILPIPAVGGTAPQFGPPLPGQSLCDKTGFGISVSPPSPSGPASGTVGCIVVFAAPLNNDALFAGNGNGNGHKNGHEARERHEDDNQE